LAEVHPSVCGITVAKPMSSFKGCPFKELIVNKPNRAKKANVKFFIFPDL
jgi:hypothetical protein